MSLFDFFPINHRVVESRLNGRYPRKSYEAPFSIDHPLGACLLMRREAIDRVGLLDERFFIYCEEIDWCLRAKRAGWEIYCVPEAKVVHYGAASTRQFRGAMLVELHRSRYELFRKHYGSLFVWAIRPVVGLGVLREMIRAKLAAWHGRLEATELEERLKAYRQILGM